MHPSSAVLAAGSLTEASLASFQPIDESWRAPLALACCLSMDEEALWKACVTATKTNATENEMIATQNVVGDALASGECDAAARAVGLLWPLCKLPVYYALQTAQKSLRAVGEASEDELLVLSGRQLRRAPQSLVGKKSLAHQRRDGESVDEWKRRAEMEGAIAEARARESERNSNFDKAVEAVLSLATRAPKACREANETWLRRAADNLMAATMRRRRTIDAACLLTLFRAAAADDSSTVAPLSTPALIEVALRGGDDDALRMLSDRRSDGAFQRVVEIAFDQEEAIETRRRAALAIAVPEEISLVEALKSRVILGSDDLELRNTVRNQLGVLPATTPPASNRRRWVEDWAILSGDGVLEALLGVVEDGHAESTRILLSKVLEKDAMKSVFDACIDSKDAAPRISAAYGVAALLLSPDCSEPTLWEQRLVEEARRPDDASRGRRHGALTALRLAKRQFEVGLKCIDDKFEDVRLAAQRLVENVDPSPSIHYRTLLDMLDQAAGANAFTIYYNLDRGRPVNQPRALAARVSAIRKLRYASRRTSLEMLALLVTPLAAWAEIDEGDGGSIRTEATLALDALGMTPLFDQELAASLHSVALATPALRRAANPDSPERQRYSCVMENIRGLEPSLENAVVSAAERRDVESHDIRCALVFALMANVGSTHAHPRGLVGPRAERAARNLLAEKKEEDLKNSRYAKALRLHLDKIF